MLRPCCRTPAPPLVPFQGLPSALRGPAAAMERPAAGIGRPEGRGRLMDARAGAGVMPGRSRPATRTTGSTTNIHSRQPLVHYNGHVFSSLFSQRPYKATARIHYSAAESFCHGPHGLWLGRLTGWRSEWAVAPDLSWHKKEATAHRKCRTIQNRSRY